MVHQRFDQRADALPATHAQDAGRKREQQKDAGHRQQGQQREQIGFGIGAADEQKPSARHDQRQRDQKHQTNVPPMRPTRVRSTAIRPNSSAV